MIGARLRTFLYNRPWHFFLLLLLCLALLLRLYGLNAYSIWLDEAWQYGSSDHPLDRIRNANSFPVDQMFLSMLVTKLHILAHFDADAWQLRLSPALFGVAAVGVIFLLVREMFDERAAWIAACLAACWPRLIQYSQEMRAYSLFVLLATVAAFALHRALRTNSIRYWALFSVAAVLELYNHYMAATNVLTFGIFAAGWILFDLLKSYLSGQDASIRRSAWTRLGLAGASGVAIGLGLLPVVRFYLRFQNAVSGQGYRGRNTLVLNSDTLHTIFGVDIGLGNNATIYLVAGLALMGFLYAAIRFPRGTVLCLLWISVPLSLAMIRSSGGAIISSTRYLQFLTPAYLSFIAAGVIGCSEGARWASRKLLPGRTSSVTAFAVRAGLCCLVLALTIRPLGALYNNNPKEVAVDLRSAYAYVLKRATSNDIVLGFGELTFWDSGWFRATDPYYLRGKQNIVREVITMGTTNYAPIPYGDIDRATGKLFAMMPTRSTFQAKLHKIAADQYDVTCWEHVCVLESRGDRPAGELFDDFCNRFQFMDPSGLAEVRKEHARARGEPKPPVERVDSSLIPEPTPADLNLEVFNGSVLHGGEGEIQARAQDGLTLIGWAMWESSLAGGVQIAVDDQLFNASYGAARADVASHFRNSALTSSGFSFSLPAHVISPGQHILTVHVLNPEGTAFRSSPTYLLTIVP